jgi:hypothetical protein
MANIKNYLEQGGDKWIVNGTLEITADGEITIDGTPINRVTAQTESIAVTVTELKDDLNNLIAKLKNSGLMADA